MALPSSSTAAEVSPAVPLLPIYILSTLCHIVFDASDSTTLTRLARTSFELHSAAVPALYRHITLTNDNLLPFFASPPRSLTGGQSSWEYTTHLQISSLPDNLPQSALPSSTSSSPLFPNLHSLSIGSKAAWALIVHSHAHTTPHPLITFLRAHTSPTHLTIHYPNLERTAHSFGGGYCCCFAAIRAFQQNPLRAAAFDRSSTSRVISFLTEGWKLESLTLKGVVDDQIPKDVRAARVEVEWAACQCADGTFHGEWCFNHVSPSKRVEQVREVLGWAAEKGTTVTMRGVEQVGGWSDIEDVGKWIDDRLAEDKKKGETCCTLTL